MNDKFALWIVEKSLILLVLSTFAVAIAGYGAGRLTLKTDERIFFDEDDPHLLAREQIEETYTRADNVMFVVVPKSNEIFTPDNLAIVEELTDAAWQLPYSVRVDSVTNFQHSFAEADDLIVGDLIENARDLSNQQIERARQIAVDEPRLVNRMISRQAHVAGINVTVMLPHPSDEAVPEIATEARVLRDAFEAKYPDVKIFLVGQVMFDQSFIEMSVKDGTYLMPMMFVVVVVVMWFMLRSFTGTLATIIVIIASIVATLGFAGWVGYSLNNINIAAPTVIMTLAVADCVHLLTSFLSGTRDGGTKSRAMVESLKLNLFPIFLTSITTAIGFLGMNSSDSPPFRELANIAAAGVMSAFLLSITMLPGLMLLLPVKMRRDRRADTQPMARLAHFVTRHQRALFWTTLLIACGILSFIPRNELNDDTIGYFSHNVPIRSAAEFTVENLTGQFTIAYSLDSGEESGISKPEFLGKVEAFSHWLREQPEVLFVETYTDVTKRLNKNMHGDDPAWYQLPEDSELAAQFHLLYEMSLPAGLDLNNLVNFDKSALRVTASIRNEKAKGIIELDERAQDWFRENAPELTTKGASSSVMFAHIGQNNINGMLIGSLIALALVTLTLMVALRSVKYGLLALIPNAFPAAIAFGLWGAFVGEVNLAVAVIFSVTLGIVVDDTVHFMSKYLRSRTLDGATPEEAVHYAISTVGVALVVTTVIVATGFLILATSDFSVNSTLGLMVSTTIVVALIFDLLFLPTVLMRAETKAMRDA